MFLRAALASGQAEFERVNEHVRAILRTLFAYGFFDRAAFEPDETKIDQQAHLRAAQRIEEGAITLLRNKRAALPLRARKLRSIALIGVNADEFTTGGGSANVNPYRFVSPREAIAKLLLVDDPQAVLGRQTRHGAPPVPACALAVLPSCQICLALWRGDPNRGALPCGDAYARLPC